MTHRQPSPFIIAKQNELVQDAQNKLHVFIRVFWNINNSNIPVYTTRKDMIKDIKDLQMNHTNYYKMDYQIVHIKLIDIRNKNPHIKVYMPWLGSL